ncbi:MAG TPA: tetratricopeptide repeat protein [Burkholderiales bacterium]
MLEKIVAADPRQAEAGFVLAGVNHVERKLDAAARGYEAVIALDARHADAHYFLGNIKGEQGDDEAAMRCYQSALEARPAFTEAARNLGALLHRGGRIAEAIACYRRLLEHGGGSADVYLNLGNALADSGAAEEAIAAFEQGLRLDPRRWQLHLAIGDLHDERGRLDASLEAYQRAFAAAPDSAAACAALGAALADQGRPEQALVTYARAQAPGLKVRAATVLPVIARSRDDISHWRSRYADELARLAETPPALADPAKEVGAAYFFLSYQGLCNRDLNRQLADFYRRACPSLLWTAPHCGRTRKPGRTRVGFISRFLHQHSIGKTSRGLVAELSRDEFEVTTVVAPPVVDDEMARAIRAASDRAVVLPPQLETARERIAELELDVLFYQDIGMDAFTYFLAFARLAPLQCVSFGHPDTTGIANIDYFVSNDLYEPADGAEHYSERLVLLRDLGTLAYYYRPQLAAPARRREDFGLPGEANLYLCPQTLFKFHPEFDAMLAGILRADPRGRLVLIEGRAKNWARLLAARFEKAFPDVARRLLFLPPQSMPDFTQLIAACDVMLDTLHFNGMNTSLEAFALGMPVVTLPSGLQRGRHTAGMYRKMQWTELVARDPDEYVRIAAGLGTEPDRRREARRQIIERSEVLFEDLRAVREFERFFRETL